MVVNVVIYVRMSLGRQSVSPARQEELARAYCKVHGYHIVEIYQDLGERGSDADRPDFLRLLEDAKSGRFQLIIVDELSRLTRQEAFEVVAQVFEPLRMAGVGLGLVDMGRTFSFDGDDLSELLLLVIGTHRSAGESKTLGRRVATGQVLRAKDGKFFPGRDKYGYRHLRDEKGVQNGYEVVPEQAAVVRRLFSWYVGGMSVSDVVGALNADRAPPPAGGEIWGKSTVHRILRDPFYYGQYVWGKVVQGKYYRVLNREVVRHSGKKTHVRQARENWIELPGAHEPVVARELFEAAQRKLDANQSRTSRAKGKATYLLSQLMRCSHCGATMHGTEVRGKARAYRCATYQSHGGCAPRTVREEVILAVLVDALRSGLPANLKDRIEKVGFEKEKSAEAADEIDRLKKRVAQIESKIAKAGRRLATIEDEFVDGVKAEIRSMKAERDKLRAEFERAATRKSPARSVEDLVERAKRLPELLKSKNPVEVQAFLRSMISRVELEFDEIPGRVYTKRPLIGGTIHVQESADLSQSFLTKAR